MGTNYYAVKVKPTLYERTIHLGKASGGWSFLFHETDEIKDYPTFVLWLKNNIDTGEYILLNEYEEEIASQDLIQLIQEKQNQIKDKEVLKLEFKYCNNREGYRFTSADFS